jgi:hypothetical protein
MTGWPGLELRVTVQRFDYFRTRDRDGHHWRMSSVSMSKVVGNKSRVFATALWIMVVLTPRIEIYEGFITQLRGWYGVGLAPLARLWRR